jgi:hypothetical protein
MSHPRNSKEQQEAEKWLISALSKELNCHLNKKRIDLNNGTWLEVDGFSAHPPVICEAWAHIGIPLSAQKNKVMADALKLIFVNNLVNKRKNKLILLFGDSKAAGHFKGKSWIAECFRGQKISIKIIKFPEKRKNTIQRAQKRQSR